MNNGHPTPTFIYLKMTTAQVSLCNSQTGVLQGDPSQRDAIRCAVLQFAACIGGGGGDSLSLTESIHQSINW
jgi:hypothetical protein